MRKIEVPKEMADTIYAKRVEQANARSAILIEMPKDLTEDAMFQYYSTAISKLLVAGLEDVVYTQKMVEELNLQNFRYIEGYYAFVED